MKNIYKKNNIKKAGAALFLALGLFTAKAQTTVLDFETFTLAPNSAYSPSANVAFQAGDASFQHKYNFSYWLGGFVYTNVTNSTTAGYTNPYGVRAYTGYTNSSKYVVGQNKGVINLTVPQCTVNGFYVTNTTYAFLSIKDGDQFTRKFGDTLGSGSGTTIVQGSYPDYFKLIVRGYKNGTLKTDSSTFMLADYTFTNNTQDYIVNTWQYLNTSNLGEVDSLKFFLRSTDNSVQNGMNTPAFFAIDNFSISKPALPTSVAENSVFKGLSVYPNPFKSVLSINLPIASEQKTTLSVSDVTGKVVLSQELTAGSSSVNLESLQQGVYFLELISGNEKAIAKLVKD